MYIYIYIYKNIYKYIIIYIFLRRGAQSWTHGVEEGITMPVFCSAIATVTCRRSAFRLRTPVPPCIGHAAQNGEPAHGFCYTSILWHASRAIQLARII